MSDNSINKVLIEIKKSKEELKNLIIASETRLQLKIEELTSKLLQLEEENAGLKNKVEYLEQQSNKNNIIIFGLNKEPKELGVELVCKEFKKLLDVKVEESEIADLQCLGHNKNCPLKVVFLTKIKKQSILKQAKKLKGTGITIAHDLTIKQREERKYLKIHLDRQRQLGKRTFIRANKLIVDNQEYSIEQLKYSENEEEQRKTSSTPATPTQVLIREAEPEFEIDCRYKGNNTPVIIKNIPKKNLRSNSSSSSNKHVKAGQ